METFQVCFNAVFTLFFCMFVGFLARQRGLIKKEHVLVMNRIGFRVFMPLMIFNSIYTSDLSSASNVHYYSFVALGMSGTFLFALLYINLTEKNTLKKGVKIQGVFRNNIAVIGASIMSTVFPGADYAFFMIGMGFCTVLMNLFAVPTLEFFSGKELGWKRLVHNIVTNPLILASVLGLLFLLCGIKLPVPLENGISAMARICSPLMLFLLGAFFEFGRIREYVRDLVEVNILKLIIAPLIVLTVAVKLGFRGIEYVGLMSTFASSTATVSFPMTQELGGDTALAAGIVVTTSAFSVLTMFLWLAGSKLLGLY